MSKNVTIKDIAAEAGVSIALVSFVMNNRVEADGKQKYRVNENTRQRVLDIARKLNYQPNSAARTLRKGRSLVIGVILSDISNVFYGEIARQMEDIAFKHGYTVLFGSSDESPEKFDRIVRTFLDKGVEGFIVVPCEGAERSLRHVMNVGVPFVIIDRKDIDIPAPKIVLDNEGAMMNAVSILAERGLRKVEMMSLDINVSSITERENGFLNSMRNLGIPDDEIRIHRAPFAHVAEFTDKVLPDVVNGGAQGLVFATNALAIASIRKLSSMGVRVQKDIHLVGFDNSDVYDLFYPSIPHISQPIDEICSMSFNYLKNLMDKEIEQRSKVIYLSGTVVR